MNPNQALWPVDGYSDAPNRKRLAYFRPWIEDRKVCLLGGPPEAQAYVKALAAEVVSEQEAEFVLDWDGRSIDSGERWTQSEKWPFAITHDPSGEFATSGPNGLPMLNHPRVGIAMPTHAHPRAALEAAATIAAEYPGDVRFAIVANGVESAGLRYLKAMAAQSEGQIEILELSENQGYGQGANAGLMGLAKDDSLDFFGVVNDDVLPGTDCLFELVHAFAELDALGHRPGAIGPVSNEINGGQRVEIGAFEDVREMLRLAGNYWNGHRSSASQTLQLRGLFLLMSRACLEAVGGFDPRFGIGNFEDDDHNLRTRLAGFTLWIAGGAFLFHHGSSTFRSLKVDYQANLRRNMETMLRKWNIEKLDDWLSVAEAPEGVAIYQPLATTAPTGHRIRINGEEVDLVHQASDMEFAAWIMNQPLARTPEGRRTLIETLQSAA